MEAFVIRRRFERLTRSLEGCCSIQLSYRTFILQIIECLDENAQESPFLRLQR
jgi:hypothetical protein